MRFRRVLFSVSSGVLNCGSYAHMNVSRRHLKYKINVMKCKSPDELFFLRLSDFVIAKHKQTMLAVLLVNSNHANAV